MLLGVGWGVDAVLGLVFLGVFFGFMLFGLGPAQFEEWDGEERHFVSFDLVMW